MQLPSNIIIYAAQPDHEELRRLIASQAPSVSAIRVLNRPGVFEDFVDQKVKEVATFWQLVNHRLAAANNL